VDIKGLAENICKKYNSRDPFEIAERRNIIVVYEPLGSIRGYYSKSLRQKFIHINQDLARQQALFTCGHKYTVSSGLDLLFGEQIRGTGQPIFGLYGLLRRRIKAVSG